jgi:hypothetical protein
MLYSPCMYHTTNIYWLTNTIHNTRQQAVLPNSSLYVFPPSRVSQTFARGPLLASKNNHGSPTPLFTSGWQVTKIKNVYLRTYCTYVMLTIYLFPGCNQKLLQNTQSLSENTFNLTSQATTVKNGTVYSSHKVLQSWERLQTAAF